MNAIRRIDVALKDHDHEVHVGSGAFRLLPAVLKEPGVGCVALVSALPERELADPGVPFTVVPEAGGEQHKALASVESYCRAVVGAGPARSDAVVAGQLAGRPARVERNRPAEHQKTAESFGVPSRLPSGVAVAPLVELMRRDKKGQEADAGPTFVLDGPRGVELVHGVDEHLVPSVPADLPSGSAPTWA
ncbi:hypothetical protein KMT30_03605 [Streptomyces sp. IBSBF 2953]|nr:hypothetical protein [Streptomyces hayashii]